MECACDPYNVGLKGHPGHLARQAVGVVSCAPDFCQQALQGTLSTIGRVLKREPGTGTGADLF